LIFSKLRRVVNRLRPFSSPFYPNIPAKTPPCHRPPMLIWMGRGILYDRASAVQPVT